MSLSEAQRAALRRRITSHPSKFDLLALLRALKHLGYQPSDLLFRHDPEEPPGHTLIANVDFRESPTRHVAVTVNIGLLGPNSPLPSYFLRFLEEVPDREAYLQFMGFFNHLCIKNLLSSIHPDHFGRYYEDWDSIRRSHLGICGLNSLERVQWLFSQFVPELPASIARSRFRQTGDYQPARTGITRLDGTGIMGRNYQAFKEGFVVKLHAEQERDSRGRSWAPLLEDRFRLLIQPLLKLHGVEVSLTLTIAEHASWAKLTQQGFLGYDRLREPHSGEHQVVLYDGSSPSLLQEAV